MRRGLLPAGLFALLLAGCEPESELRRLQKNLPVREGMNVIIVSFDALRADALGVYGSPRGTSPEIDRFARESVVFDNAYTVAPVTPTSFASAFTGLLPHRVFHDWNMAYQDTLATRFAAAGYATAAFLNNTQLTTERNFHTGFEVYRVFRSVEDDEIVKDSLEWLRGRRQDKIFAWIHFLSPHSPYDYREMAAHLYDPVYQGEFERTSGAKFDTEDPREIERIKSLYEGEVFHGDALFGELVEGLRELDLLETSLVLVTSDHGEEFKEHGGFQHDRLTEEHVKVPLLLYHPSVRSPARSRILVSNVDFFPTLLSMTGIEFDTALDGQDLIRISSEPEWIVGVSMTGGYDRWLSLRDQRYKLIQTCLPEPGQALFDLAADPGEHTDVHLEHPELTKDLYRRLGAVMGGPPCAVMQAAVSNKDPAVGLSAENVEALKALGYLGD